jgi:hypothetical protein
MIIHNRIAQLIIKYRGNDITQEERKELSQWVSERDGNFLLFLELIDDEYLHGECEKLMEGDRQANWKKIEQKILPALSNDFSNAANPVVDLPAQAGGSSQAP